MISRWDSLVNHMVHEGYEDVPYHIRFRCERCGSSAFYHLDPPREEWADPVTVIRGFVLRCTRCGLIEATVARTDILGGGRP